MIKQVIIKSALKWMFVLLPFFTVLRLEAQCHQNNLQANQYTVGQCNGFTFQSTVGSIVQSYGNCGGLFFTPPITGGDIISSTDQSFNDFSPTVIPNPTLNTINIDGLGDINLQIEIYNTMGSLLMRRSIHSTDKIDVTDLNEGIHFLRIIPENSRKSRIIKFIKIK